jgi:hypothetical protein
MFFLVRVAAAGGFGGLGIVTSMVQNIFIDVLYSMATSTAAQG